MTTTTLRAALRAVLLVASILLAWCLTVAVLSAIVPPRALADLAIGLRSLGLLLSLGFVLRYSQKPWRSTPEGRHLMSFSIIVALFLLYATVNNITAALDPYVPPGIVDGDYPGRLAIGVTLYGGVAWVMWRRNRLLTLAQREIQ